jgi:circadian clock protein KaiC
MDRIGSGSAALDKILDGGFPRNSINIIMGLPGTGKTILAEKAVFCNATPEAPALYLSTVSEPLDKMLRYLQEFDYFDASLVGEAVIYEDLSAVLRSEGLDALVQEVVRLIKEHRPGLVVIDSFKALHAFSSSAGEFRQKLSELMTVLSSLAITSFLVGEYSSDDVASMPEFAVADGVIELVLQKVGVRDVRYLRVVKERGSGFLNGEHAFKIGRGGLDIFPRLQTPASAIAYELVHEREETGVEVFDAMVADGFWRGASTVVFGPPGSGKTLLGLHFIFKGIERGQKGLIATMEENPTQLHRIVAGFGWDLQKAIDDGMLELYYVSPVDIYIDEFVSTVSRMALASGAKRVMIDSLNDLEASAPDTARFRDFMYSMVQTMATKGISTYMTSEVRNLFSTSVLTEFGISHMSDNVVLIHYVRQESEIKRAISIVKTRASRHDPVIRQFTITPEGIIVGEPFSDADFGSGS